ncbi:hypothetical protein JHK87_002481 [Glycine soja]|nr:hypothetical protein JHK87_002481 [Glycine soja]
MDDSLDITPSQGESNPQSTKKRGRGPTRLKKLRLKRVRDQKISIEFDQSTGNAKGPNRTEFNNYVSFLARSKVSILHEDWDHVEESVKNMIWQTIMLNYDIPNSEFLKKKLISYAGTRWRGFKTQLSSLYIYGKYQDKSPCDKYAFLEEETWQRFVQSRLDPAFQEKRKKAQEAQANNLYPHTLSCGGYQKLEENMMQEKVKQIQEASQLDPSLAVVEPPSPLKRHEKWKRARQKKSGDYINEDARIIAEKIDSLVEQSTQGSFVPLGREDILTTAIGQPEHPGRVRGAGRGVGIRQYFGPPSRNPLSMEDLEVITQRIQEQVTKKLSEQLEHKLKADLSQQFQEQVRQELASLGLLQQNTNIEPTPSSPINVSTKGNYATPDPSVEDNHTNIRDQCELYVDVDPPHLVAIGKVYNLGSTIHHKTIEDDNVRVVVEEVRDAEAQVPLPTNEVQTVGQAPNQFIQWQRRLVKSISVKTIVESSKDVRHKRLEPQLGPLERLLIIVSKIRKDHVQLPWDPDVLSKPSTMSFHIYRRDIFELCMGSEMLNISVIQLWLMYLHSLCTDKGNAHIYGFMDPQSIQSVGNNATEVQGYLQSRLHERKKQCYLAPYLHSDHWQLLIICPKQNVVVLLCSLHKKTINKEMKTIVNLAMDEYQRLVGSQSRSRRKKPTWILPRCQTQSKGYECGYYVMKQMFTVVTVDIVDSWKQLFNNSGPFPEEDIADIQQRWAAFLLQISNL